MILKLLTDNTYVNLNNKFTHFLITKGSRKYFIQGSYPSESEGYKFVTLHEADDEVIAQTILDEIIHRWISGDKYCNISDILDAIKEAE